LPTSRQQYLFHQLFLQECTILLVCGWLDLLEDPYHEVDGVRVMKPDMRESRGAPAASSLAS